MPVTALKNALDLDHYTLGAYGTAEPWQLKIVVVDPSVSEPIWVRAPRVRKVTRRTALALVIPSLDALRVGGGSGTCGVLTDYIAVRPLSKANRRKGLVVAEGREWIPWHEH